MFGASSATPFGAAPAAQSSAGLYGTPSSGGLFGSSIPASGGLFGSTVPSAGGLFSVSTPASGGLFGNPSPSPGALFGTPGTSQFGAQSSGSLFGATQATASAVTPSTGGLFGAKPPSASGGLFGTQASSAGLFGGGNGIFNSTGPSMYGANSAQFGGTVMNQPAGYLGMPVQPQQGMPQQMQVQMAQDGKPITTETNFSDLPEQWQNAFKAVHSKVAEIKKDWRALQASVQVQQSAQPDQEYANLSRTAKQLHTDLQAAQKRLELDNTAAERFHADVRVLAEATQHVHIGIRANAVRREIEMCRDEAQKQAKILQNAQLFKSMGPLPAPYLSVAMNGFGKELQRLEAMQQDLAILCGADGRHSNIGAGSLACLPNIMRSVHELFVHAAARVSQLLAATARMRAAHLQAQADQGIHFDPFAEADVKAFMDKAEQGDLPAIKPVKPQLFNAALSGKQDIAGLAFTAQPAVPNVGLPSPSSTPQATPSLFGRSSAFGSTAGRSNVKAKRR